MRSLLPTLSLIALLAAACTGKGPAGAPAGSAPTDPKALYSMEVSAQPAKVGETSSFRIAIRTVEGAEVKEETPFRASLSATGPLSLDRTSFDYGDRRGEVGGGPYFEFPVEATGPGQGEVAADLTFFVCMAEACLRTTEKLSIPIAVQ